MTDQDPPLHHLDADHAATIQWAQRWVNEVYPATVTDFPDRTRLWWACSKRFFDMTVNETDIPSAIGMLAQLTAEAMLRLAELQHKGSPHENS